MGNLFKPDIQQLNQAARNFQYRLETVVMDFLENDLDEVRHGVTGLYHQSRLLSGTLLCILQSSALAGRMHWKRQNRQLINGINRSCTAMHRLQSKLKELHGDAARGLVCDSSLCALAVFWHRFVLFLKQTTNDLHLRPARRKRTPWRHSMVNA